MTLPEGSYSTLSPLQLLSLKSFNDELKDILEKNNFDFVYTGHRYIEDDNIEQLKHIINLYKTGIIQNGINYDDMELYMIIYIIHYFVEKNDKNNVNYELTFHYLQKIKYNEINKINTNVEIYEQLIFHLEKIRDYENMVKYYKKAIELGSKVSINNLAFYYQSIKDYENMEKYYLMSIDFYNNKNSMFNLATYYRQIKKYDFMLLYCLTIIEDDECDNEPLNPKGFNGKTSFLNDVEPLNSKGFNGETLTSVNVESLNPKRFNGETLTEVNVEIHLQTYFLLIVYYHEINDYENLETYYLLFNKTDTQKKYIGRGLKYIYAIGNNYEKNKKYKKMFEFYFLCIKNGKLGYYHDTNNNKRFLEEYHMFSNINYSISEYKNEYIDYVLNNYSNNECLVDNACLCLDEMPEDINKKEEELKKRTIFLCGHSFCKECTKGLLNSNVVHYICPLCRHIIC